MNTKTQTIEVLILENRLGFHQTDQNKRIQT